MTHTIDPRDFSVPQGTKVDIRKCLTHVKHPYQSKKKCHNWLNKQVDELTFPQRLHYASNGYAVLIIFRDIDAAVKDGAIRHVVSGVNPRGFQVLGFKLSQSWTMSGITGNWIRLRNDCGWHRRAHGAVYLPYKKATYENYVGIRGVKKRSKKIWQRHVVDVVKRLSAALEPDDVVLGGGNANKFIRLPPGCRASENANAFLGRNRLWADADGGRRPFKNTAFIMNKRSRAPRTPGGNELNQ